MSRDGNDLEITGAAVDESDYLTVADGQLGYDFSNDYSLDYVFFTIPVSSQMLDAAHASGQPIVSHRRAEVSFLSHHRSGVFAKQFTVSPDWLFGAYQEGSWGPVTIFDTISGEVIPLKDKSSYPSWTPDCDLLYSYSCETDGDDDAIKLFGIETSTSRVVTARGKRDQHDLVLAQCSPDGQHVIYKAGVFGKGNTSTHSWLTVRLDWTERIVMGDARGVLLCWVAD